MKLFKCQKCEQVLYFENFRCERCGLAVGYLPHLDTLSAVTPDGPEWIAMADPDKRYRFCANWEHQACNWLVEIDGDPAAYCAACRHNRTVPEVSDPVQRALWVKLEDAKRRLFYSLLKLGLPTPAPGSSDPEPLVFDFLAEMPDRKVVTGHDDGVITIGLEEADDAARESMRTRMHEPYRTLVGHFRHEVGHYYWDKLVRDLGKLDSFRAIFGDERQDYQQSMDKYYASGPPPNWQDSHVSAYATMHPWEDFAETWAHYLHIVDTLEMAYTFGVSVAPRVGQEMKLAAKTAQNPYSISAMDDLIAQWLPIVFAVNSINRTMGQPDLYPFVLSPSVLGKMDYVRQVITRDPRTGIEPGALPDQSKSARRRGWSLFGARR